MNDKIDPENQLLGVTAKAVSGALKNHDVIEAGRIFGKSALIIAETVQTALLPLAALNYGAEKAKEYFEKKFERDISERLQSIPVEDIVQPKASIAGPALQGLAFSHEEDELKNLYLGILANAMDNRPSSYVHPAFIEVVKQLSSDDVFNLNVILRHDVAHELIEVHVSEPNLFGFKIVLRHVMNLLHVETNEATENPLFPTYVDNWIRLGLVKVDYDRRAAGPNSYNWVEQRPEILRLRKESDHQGFHVKIVRGTLTVTDFGKSFAKAVGLI